MRLLHHLRLQVYTLTRNRPSARAPQKHRTDHEEVSGLACFTQLPLSKTCTKRLVVWCVSPNYHSARESSIPELARLNEATSSRGDWRREMEAEQRESATSATAIADAEDIESQRYRPCCERPDDSMSCIARPASNRCRVATKSTRLAENATLLASLGGQARCAAAVCAYFVNGDRPTVKSTTTLRAG